MPLLPGAEHRLLPENTSAPRIQPTQLIFHSIVGSAEGAYRYFARVDVRVESHFIVARTGRIIQLVDTTRQADANYHANIRAISVETEDNGEPDRDPWTDAQIQALLRIARFCHEQHGIPRRQCPRWDAPGVGYHSLFPEWSNIRGKTCPGRIRIDQYRRELLPAIVAGRWPDITPPRTVQETSMDNTALYKLIARGETDKGPSEPHELISLAGLKHKLDGIQHTLDTQVTPTLTSVTAQMETLRRAIDDLRRTLPTP